MTSPEGHFEVDFAGGISSSLKYNIDIQGGPKVNTHTLGLIAPPWFTFEDCYFADGVLYLLVRGFRRQNFKIRIIRTTPSQY